MKLGASRYIDTAILLAAMAAAFGLGLHALGAASLWHDEAVQVHVANNLLETGRPLLPSGRFHPVAPVYNAVMAGAIWLFGDSEAAVRLPSVLFAAVNVLLTYVLARALLGRGTALLAAVGLALSPWSVAWSREARFYSMQQTAYLLMVIAAWRMTEAKDVRGRAGCGAGAVAAYLLGLGTSLHSVVFLMPVAAYAFLMAAGERRRRSQWLAYAGAAVAVGIATMAVYRLTLPRADADAIFKSAGLGLQLSGSETPLFYYFQWLWQNLGIGFFILALAGTGVMLWREGRRGLYAALAFWAPVLALTFLLGYRRHRFIFFAYPLYVTTFSYLAANTLEDFVRVHIAPAFGRNFSWQRLSETFWTGHEPLPLNLRIPALVMLTIAAAFYGRVGLSGVYLFSDTLRTARGADITLATRHPQWRGPCRYVQERLQPGEVVVSSTYVAALYYVGRCDSWYPSRHFLPEAWEVGSEGLKNVDELAAYMAEHPRGYLLLEWGRFWEFGANPDVTWVDKHMTRIPEACSGDVRVYGWGLGESISRTDTD